MAHKPFVSTGSSTGRPFTADTQLYNTQRQRHSQGMDSSCLMHSRRFTLSAIRPISQQLLGRSQSHCYSCSGTHGLQLLVEV